MTDPSAGMGARAAWAWLAASPGHGVRTGRVGPVHVYMPAPGVVEVSVPGTHTSHDMGEADFRDYFSEATFYPITTAEVAA